MKFSRFLFASTRNIADISAPEGNEEAVPTDAGTVLAIAMDVGAETLRVGGEIHRVEDTVTRICLAYGAEAVEVFAITSLITAEVRMPDGTYATHNRRVPVCKLNWNRAFPNGWWVKILKKDFFYGETCKKSIAVG